jgi:membrane protease YdiL (CAAX protease family)
MSLLVLAIIWVLAAFAEELVYRGYLLNRVAELGGATRGAWIVSLLLVSAAFGFDHLGQGLSGQIIESIAGLLLALVYLGAGRNLVVAIVAHGIADTIDVALIYLDAYPGM